MIFFRFAKVLQVQLLAPQTGVVLKFGPKFGLFAPSKNMGRLGKIFPVFIEDIGNYFRSYFVFKLITGKYDINVTFSFEKNIIIVEPGA